MTLLVLVGLAHAADSVTFLHRPIDEGAGFAFSSSLDMSVRLALTAPGANTAVPVDVRMTERDDKRVVVQAVGPEGPTRVQITWGDRTTSQSGLGQVDETRSPVSGRTYVLDIPGSRVTAPGAEPSAEELSIVLDERALFQELRSLVESMPGETFDVGQTVDLGDARLGGQLGLAQGGLEVKGVRDHEGSRCGVFALVVHAATERTPAGLHVEMELTGEALVETSSGWLRSLSLSGPVRLTGASGEPGQQVRMAGEGTMTFTSTMTPLR